MTDALTITEEDRDWINNRADELFRESERRRGSISTNTIRPENYRDYFLINATVERFLRAEPVSVQEAGIRSLTTNVDVGDGAVMTIPDPRAYEDGGLEWCLRYTCGDLPNNVQFQAASVIDSLDHLLGGWINNTEAMRRLRLMRARYRALAADKKE